MGQSTTTMNPIPHVIPLDSQVNEGQGLPKPRRPHVTQAYLPNLEHLKERFRPLRLAPPNPPPKRLHALTELLPPVFLPSILNFHFPALLHTTPPNPLQNRLYLPQLKPLRRRRSSILILPHLVLFSLPLRLPPPNAEKWIPPNILQNPQQSLSMSL